MSREAQMGMGGKSRGDTSSGNTGNGGNNREQYGAVGQYTGTSPTSTNGGGSIEPPYVMVGGKKFAVNDPAAIEAQNTLQKESLLSNVIDLYQQYSPLNFAINLTGNIFDTLGNPSKTLQNKAITFDLQNRLKKAYQDPKFDPLTPDSKVTELEKDLEKAKANNFTQSEYESKYGLNNLGEDDRGEGERQLLNALTPLAPFALTDTTPQKSMVNDYFANANLGQQLSSDLQTRYNNAKNNLNNVLNIQSVESQYGFVRQPNLLNLDLTGLI